MATPEYMPPEFLQVLIRGGKHNKSPAETLADIANPWSVDMWSLGSILLEILTGVPLWMSLKCKAEINGKSSLKHGLFAVKGRAYDKIYTKQKQIIENFREHLGPYVQAWHNAD